MRDNTDISDTPASCNGLYARSYIGSKRFARHYRDVAIPRLRNSAGFLAILIVCGERDFDWSVAELVAEARRMGGDFLPKRLFRDLVATKLPSWLLSSVVAVRPAWAEAQRLSDKVALDIERCEMRQEMRHAA